MKMEQQLVDMNECENEVKNKSLVYFDGKAHSHTNIRRDTHEPPRIYTYERYTIQSNIIPSQSYAPN